MSYIDHHEMLMKWMLKNKLLDNREKITNFYPDKYFLKFVYLLD